MLNRIRRCLLAHVVRVIVCLVSLGVSPAVLAQTVAIIHVDGQNGSASPAGLGDDWGNNHGYRYLQDALARADTLLAGGTPPSRVEVWVIGNTTNPYRPDQSAANTPGTNSRNDTFVMKQKVRLYGGFDSADTDLSG